MGKQRKTRQFAQVKRMINPKDPRIAGPMIEKEKKGKKKAELVRHIERAPSSMFFAANSALGPPYHVLVDTNFINFSIQVRWAPPFRPSANSSAREGGMPHIHVIPHEEHSR